MKGVKMNIELLVIELAKIGLQGTFNYLRAVGKTEEEIDEFYWNEKSEFLRNHPSKLPRVE
jgi:hypothetical protein